MAPAKRFLSSSTAASPRRRRATSLKMVPRVPPGPMRRGKMGIFVGTPITGKALLLEAQILHAVCAPLTPTAWPDVLTCKNFRLEVTLMQASMTDTAKPKTLHFKRSHFATQLPVYYLYSPSHLWL